jgi:5-methylcytosine-specific restriction endonuclease McrA
MKECTKCKKTKSSSEFSKDKQKKDGLSSSCKACKKSYDTDYVSKYKDKKYATNQKYNEAHRAEKQAYDKARREAIRDTINAKKREYYHSTGKTVGDVWRKANWSNVLTYAKNAKTKRRLIERTSTLTGPQLHKWVSDQVKICTYCNTNCSDAYHVDHVIPLAIGGAHEISNLTIACPTCNISKGKKTPEEWKQIKQQSVEVRDKKL